MKQHLVLFDKECPLCHRAVQYLIRLDKNHELVFAPLNGTTAKGILTGRHTGLKKANSLVLVENFESPHRRFWLRSKAIFRIYQLIGKKWLGLLFYLPSWMGDWFYKRVAEHRHQFKLKMKELEPGDRFLP